MTKTNEELIQEMSSLNAEEKLLLFRQLLGRHNDAQLRLLYTTATNENVKKLIKAEIKRRRHN